MGAHGMESYIISMVQSPDALHAPCGEWGFIL